MRIMDQGGPRTCNTLAIITLIMPTSIPPLCTRGMGEQYHIKKYQISNRLFSNDASPSFYSQFGLFHYLLANPVQT